MRANIVFGGKNLMDMQEMNRSLVLRLLKKNNICSRAELAKQSGLKQATITNIINDFIDWGIVSETGLLAGHKGRRSIGVQINHKEYYVIGVRLTRKYFHVGLFDIFGQLISSKTVTNNILKGAKVVVENMKVEINNVIATNKEKRVLGIGIAVPGPYLSNEGKIMGITDFPGWDKIPLKAEMTNAFELPVIIDHDANAGAMAEWCIAQNETGRTLVYLAVGQGIGAGIINDGMLFRGTFGIAGEIGHASVNINGPICACGNRGCLTGYASTTDFMKKVREEMPNYKNTCLKEGFTFRELVDAVKKKDELATVVFEDITRYLAMGIINIICAYNPDVIVIGDEMSELGEDLINMLHKHEKGRTYKYFADFTELRISDFNIDPAFVGAAALAIDYSLSNTNIFDTKEAN